MVRVSTVYDKDIKEQVFMIRGDERYARSTKTVIELRSIVEEDTFGYIQEIFVNVFRDVGEGSLTVYDNDVVITVIDDWSSTDTGRVIQLPQLAYESEHNIRVKYMGNGRCSPSMSNLIHIDSKENPNKHNIPLLMNTTFVSFDEHETIPVQVYFEGYPSEYDNKEIKIYYDDEYIDTVPISPLNGEARINIDCGTNGLHKVKAVFEGTLLMNAKSVTTDIGVGYNLAITSAPRVLITGDTVTFKVKLTDYFNTPKEGKSIVATVHDTGNVLIGASGQTGSDGRVTLTGTVPANVGDGTIDFKHSNKVLNFIKLPSANITSFTLNSAIPRLYINEENVLSASIGQSKRGIPITFKDVTWDTPTERILTDDNGIATKTIKGRGIETQEWIASVGHISERLKLPDYYQYWERSENVQIGDYTLSSGASLLKLPNYFKLYAASGRITLTIDVPNNVLYTLEIQDVYASAEGSSNQAYYIASGKQYTLHTNHKNIGIRRDSSGRVGIYEDKSLVYTVANQNYALPMFRFNPNTTFVKLTVRLEED